MSGYLDVKYPLKPNLGLNPFKSWKRQWCILRPSSTCVGGGAIAIYCSEAGAAVGTVELPPGCVIRRRGSRTRPHSFAVFTPDEPRKPRVLLAALSAHESHVWMDKIRGLMNDEHFLGTEALFKDSFSATVSSTELSRKQGLSSADCILTLSSNGLLISRSQKLGMFIDWQHVDDVKICDNEKNVCILNVNSQHPKGGGQLKLSSPLVGDLVASLNKALKNNNLGTKKLSRSEGDLRVLNNDIETGDNRRSSWYSGPSDVSLDDTDLVISKESTRVQATPLSRCAGTRSLLHKSVMHSIASFDDSMSDRRSLLSVASGIYEEIPDLPDPSPSDSLDLPEDKLARLDSLEPTYESVAECVYATMRRSGRRFPPPPLPPRVPFGTSKLGESWNSRMNKNESNVTRHSSLGSLPRCYSVGSASTSSQDSYTKTKTLPKDKSKQSFNVFRKRLKSDSRITTSSPTTKENKDIETKKKKFDFAPTRDIFKNFKVNRKMKNLKITSTLSKVETKSCEFLDDSEHVASKRCSKSVECLDGNLDETDFSFDFNDDWTEALALPQEIVDVIMRSREQMNRVMERKVCDPEISNACERDNRRSSWYSGPSDVSLDDTDLVISKESTRVQATPLSRCAGTRSLLHKSVMHSIASFDDSMSDRRSLLSVASGIYEEIPDLPDPSPSDSLDLPEDKLARLDSLEPTYESVAECVYATMRRSGRRFPPPPLPPRVPFGVLVCFSGDNRRSSWYSGPSDVSLDDTDLVISKESTRVQATPLSRCAGTRSLLHKSVMHSIASFDDSMSDRRSLLSVASGIYEEIPDLPDPSPSDSLDLPEDKLARLDSLEPTYESVAECVYATMRRSGRRFPPPPLPPRVPFG